MRGVRRGIALPEIDSLLREGVVASLPDKDLLERFVSARDRGGELAFTMLVARHGPMVLGVCRRILRDRTEADDAFQATFLVLARKAGSIRLGDSLGPWLHGVSSRVARRLQSIASRRRGGPHDDEWLHSLADRRTPGTADMDRSWEVAEALNALPASFRSALWLCYFEGLTHEEAAARLGCPVGTVRSRLARGRALMRCRLEDPTATRANADPGGGPEPTAFGSRVAPVLLETTVQAASRVAAGLPLAGVVPARVFTVAMGVINTMSRTRIFAATCLLVSITSLAGWAALAGQSRLVDGASSPAPGDGAAEVDQAQPPILLAQAPTVARRKASGSAGNSQKKPASDLPADFPAFVVETQPKLGDVDVDAATTTEIRVVFSKPMMDKTWSLTSGNVYATPESTGVPHYLADNRTWVTPVKLEPGKTYVVGINGGRFNNFKEANGRPSLPSSLAFRTRPAK